MTVSEKPSGEGVHYLWHLEQIGCIERETYKPLSAWKSFLGGDTPATSVVAIIDNGCSLTHPNLPVRTGAISKPIEFAAHIRGTVYNDDPEEDDPRERFRGFATLFSDLGLKTPDEVTTYLGKGISDPLRQVILDYVVNRDGCTPENLKIPSPSERFAAHGTACAGLVGGRPEPEPAVDTETGEMGYRNPSALAYFGVNPFATIIPVATVYSHAYWPLVMALLYAAAQKPDVILIPRAMEEMRDPAIYAIHEGGGRGDEADPRDNGNLRDSERWAEKQLFEKLLGAISERIPVVVAAGNTGGPELEYPAKLVDSGAPDLIVAGAATANGYRATFSSGFDKEKPGSDRHKVTVYAPSDDREETSAQHFRAFDLAWRSRRLRLDRFEGAQAQSKAFAEYAPYGVLAIDIAGQYGYDSSSAADLDFREDRIDPEIRKGFGKPETLPRALYTHFGGTSAASAIVAGVVSLLKATEQGRMLSGTDMRQLLENVRPCVEAATRDDLLVMTRTDQQSDSAADDLGSIQGINLQALADALEIAQPAEN